ncbi:EAL domain-containing protein [Aurantiacibacter spongiae]|nr:EAL domain-containing protein [Aurantiacibacter spongiae]
MSLPVHQIDRRLRGDRRQSEPHPVASDLGQAITADAIDLLFQPQYAAAGNALSGAEALARWHHPVHGSLAGDALVAIAQSSGLARRLTRHIVRGALGVAADWPAHLRLSLNVTAADLLDRTYVDDLLALVADSGVAAERLTLEITEHALVADLDRSAERLALLAEAGIRIALDDFGAGFCNFHYLKVLPLDALKLDRSMVQGVAHDRRDLAILRAIVAMARTLELRIIAEGIETPAQRDVAAREGCDLWQGFLGGRPMTSAAFADHISAC